MKLHQTEELVQTKGDNPTGWEKKKKKKREDKGNVLTEFSRVSSIRTEQGMKSGCCVTQMSPKLF